MNEKGKVMNEKEIEIEKEKEINREGVNIKELKFPLWWGGVTFKVDASNDQTQGKRIKRISGVIGEDSRYNYFVYCEEDVSLIVSGDDVIVSFDVDK